MRPPSGYWQALCSLVFACDFNRWKSGGPGFVSYKLRVKNIKDASAAHIHKGKKGENGPPVVGLFSGERKGKFSGTLSEGMITEKELLGDFQGKPLEELINLILAGDAYINVHTDANPDGEIRGQIK